MHSALFVASYGDKEKDWQAFVGLSESRMRTFSKHIVRISENVWLINAKEAVGAPGALAYSADSNGISYGILPLEREPKWLPVGFYPKSMPDPQNAR